MAALGLAAMAIPAALHAQTATIVGYPVNFDTVNDTGQVTHGFEIEADGLQPSDMTRVFGGVQPSCLIRYCTGSIVPFAGGVYIRWVSPYDPTTGQFTQGTPLPNGTMRRAKAAGPAGSALDTMPRAASISASVRHAAQRTSCTGGSWKIPTTLAS